MSGEQLIITPEQAESLLPEGNEIHSFTNPAAGMFIGCDHERASVIAKLRAAKQIEIAGENCKRMKHPLAVWETETKVLFFAADMVKVEAFEAARVSP